MSTSYVRYPTSGGGGTGTVTSVALAAPAIFTVTGSPVTSSGTLTLALANESANTVFAGPVSGGAAAPTFRALVAADLPALTSAHLYVGNASNVATDVAASGDLTLDNTGAFTLATVNTQPGLYGDASHAVLFNVTGKGLITASASTPIIIAESQVTNLVSDLAGKQATGNYITALTGDITASGPGSVAATLATVNSNVGSFGSSTSIPSVTVNAKGLVTAASGNVVIAPAGTLSGTTLNATVVSSGLTSVGTIATGTWAGTTITADHGGTGVANNVASTLTMSGNFATTLTRTATTNVTLPTTGTLATLAGSETLTNKTLTAPVIATIVSGSATSTLSTLSTGTGTLAPFTNWAAYTPTVVGLGTISNVSAFWRREGDSFHARGSFTCGTGTAVAVTISINGNTVDSTKVPVDQTAFLGTFYRAAGGGVVPSTNFGAFPITAITGTSTSTVFLSISTNSATPGFPTLLGNALPNSGDRLMFDFEVPVTQFAF